MLIAKKHFRVFVPNMMEITNTELTALNKDFYIFQSQVSKSNRQNPSYFISQLNQFEKNIKKPV